MTWERRPRAVYDVQRRAVCHGRTGGTPGPAGDEIGSPLVAAQALMPASPVALTPESNLRSEARGTTPLRALTGRDWA